MNLRHLICSFLVLVAAVSARASEPSVWDQAKAKSYGLEGKVKAISIDESAHQIFVKIARSGDQGDQKKVETIKVCSQDMGSSIQTFEQSERMVQIRQALSSGAQVRVVYNGPFDRCLNQIVTLNE